MGEPGDQVAIRSEAVEIVSGLLNKQAPLIDKFVAALGPGQVKDLGRLLEVLAPPGSGEVAESDAEVSPELQAAISEEIARHAGPMIDEFLNELELDLDEDEEIEEEELDKIVGRLIDAYLNEIRTALGI